MENEIFIKSHPYQANENYLVEHNADKALLAESER